MLGSENLLPKPVDDDQAYTLMRGELFHAAATAEPVGLKATPYACAVMLLEGFEYFVPKPEPDHAYALMKGASSPPVNIASLLGLNATESACPGITAGLLYLLPKPADDQAYTESVGELSLATAKAVADGLKATDRPVDVGSVAGLANFVPKPEPLHGYAVM